MKQITFITGNEHKLKQTKLHLSHPLTHIAMDLPEIQSLNPLEVVKAKAEIAFERLKTPILIEDTSLTFHALGKLPGPFIKWFSEELGNEGLCRLLDTYEDKSATAWVIFAYFDGQTYEVFDIQQKGKIADRPRGTHVFGWNAIFVPDGETKTFAEMNDEEQKKISLRKRALIKFEKYLQDHE